MSHASDKNAGEGQYGPKWGIWEIPPLPPCTDLSRITANATRQEADCPCLAFLLPVQGEGEKLGDALPSCHRFIYNILFYKIKSNYGERL